MYTQIHISDEVRKKLIYQGVEALDGKDNWLTYINHCLEQYQNEELMREVYAIKRRLSILKKISDKTDAEINEEVQLLHQWQSESPGKKLTRIHNDNLFFKQRRLLSGESNVEKTCQDKKSIFSLWIRFADLLNEKLMLLDEAPVIDKQILQAVCVECSSLVFDHPQQLIADLKSLTHIQYEIVYAAQDILYLETNSAAIYRAELKQVFDEVVEEKNKIVRTLQKIQRSIYEGSTQNIAVDVKAKIDSVFQAGLDLQKSFNPKELSIIQEIHNIDQKVFPSRIMKKDVYTVKDYLDISRTTSPSTGFALKEGKPLEVEMIPDEKPAFFRFGKNALFQLFSNTNALALNEAFQDLEALHVLYLNNQHNPLMNEIARMLPHYSDVFRKRLKQHKQDVENKINELKAGFISRWISTKECQELENWLARLIRSSSEAEGIIQTITLTVMQATIDAPQKFEVLRDRELNEREIDKQVQKQVEQQVQQQAQNKIQNHALALETNRLIQHSSELSVAFREVVGNVENKVGPPPKPPRKILSKTLIESSASQTSKEKSQENKDEQSQKKSKVQVVMSPDNQEASRSVQELLKESTELQKINEALAKESEVLVTNFIELQKRREAILGDTSLGDISKITTQHQYQDHQSSQQPQTQKESVLGLVLRLPIKSKPESSSFGVLVDKQTQIKSQGNPMTKEFSKTLATICVAHGNGMKGKQRHGTTVDTEKIDVMSKHQNTEIHSPSNMQRNI
jgi:hypothetical protein